MQDQAVVDTSSIIENKILTKTYWEKKMLDEQKLISTRLLIPNRGDRKAKLLSDGESVLSSSDSSLNPVDSLDPKPAIQQHCASEFENDSLFVKKSIELMNAKLEKQDHQSDEEELYSDCLEQFVDDIHINKLNHKFSDNLSEKLTELTKLNDLNEQSNKEQDREQLTVIEEEAVCCSISREKGLECDHQSNNKLNSTDKDSKEKLRVKVEGSNQTEQMNYIEATNLKLTTKLNDLNSKVNSNEIDKQVNEKIPVHTCTSNAYNNNKSNNLRAVHQEQVIIENVAAHNSVKPNEQGDQVCLTQQQQSTSICSKINSIATQSVDTSTKDYQANKTSNCLKENSFSHENHLKVSPAAELCLKKSESPIIYFQQRVSEVKINFENKFSIMNQSDQTVNKTDKQVEQAKKTKNISQLYTKQVTAKKQEQDQHLDAGSKIAHEIREFKEREEELRKIRLDRLNKKNLSECTVDCLSNSSSSNADSSVARSSSSRSESPNTTNTTDQCSAISSIDSLDEGFAEFKSPNSNVKNPSEIQKILATNRIQLEIEEQTKRELDLKALGKVKTISQERTDKLIMNNLLSGNLNLKTTNLLSPSLSLSSLASSLSSLNIMNNSQMSSQMNSLNQSTDKQLISSPSSFSDKSTNQSLKTPLPTTSTPTSSLATPTTSATQAKSKANLYVKNQNGLLKQRTFSTSHLNNLNSLNSSNSLISSNMTSPFKMNQQGRHISMAKFIKTKGKSFVVESSNQFNNGNIGHTDLSYSYTDLLRPPKVDLVTAHKILQNKLLQTADYKIASELQDLHRREEELRKQRSSRLSGQSQPNLSLIDNEDKATDQSSTPLKDTSGQNKNSSVDKAQLITTLANNNQLIQNYSLQGSNLKGKLNLLKKTASNPNLNDSIDKQSDHQLLLTKNAAKGVIMKFEEKIQKIEKIK